MALVASATRPWQVTRSKLVRPRLIPSSRYESSSSTAEPSSSSSSSGDTTPSFPWRHAAEPLERVVAMDNLSGLPIQIQQQESFLQKVVMANMLGRSWYELFLPSVWKASLANDFSWAFQKGLAALLSRVFSGNTRVLRPPNIYGLYPCLICSSNILILYLCYGTVPIQDIDQEEFGIIHDSGALSVEKDTPDVSNEDSNTSNTTTAEHQQPSSVEQDSYCNSMLEQKLIEFYASVDPSTTNVLLCMKPVSSKIENIFSVSFTRNMVQEDASLVEIGRKMRYTAQVDRNPMEAARMLGKLEQKGKSINLFTVICDVSIQCLEAFAVKDKNSGAIVSGSTEPEEVLHLVRFEVAVNMDGTSRLNSWRVVDWDDMLNGNVWY
jgi:hypothetical protein